MEKEKLCHIYDISLFSINDFDVLLHEILKQVRSILFSEAGSIYIREDNALTFNVFQNDTMSYENIYKQFINLKDKKLLLEEQEKYLAVKSFITKKIIIVDNIYDTNNNEFEGVKEYDKRFDYKTHSIITIPLTHPIENKTLGVLQLLNKKIDENYVPFDEKDKQILSLVSSFIALSISKAQSDVEKLKKLNQRLEVANKKLEERVEEEILENERKSEIIYNQSKLASMGEMIGNIAHQWRQPLSAISTLASGLCFNLENTHVEKKETISALNRIVDTTLHLSDTIDDFRNFYKKDKEKVVFNIFENLQRSMAITRASLNDNHINLIFDVDETIEFYGYYNELKQAILNIIQNAKDALIENVEVGNRFIFVSLKKQSNKIFLNIKDNANGIPYKIIGKIFEQNFTTKEGNGGTGIGLYMTKQIIEKHMDGIINVINEEFEYENKKYKGASFTIQFNETSGEIIQ
jgi:two-component system, NtrC family, C4-dicarboxylate transport sensor histidine kinase DctB